MHSLLIFSVKDVLRAGDSDGKADKGALPPTLSVQVQSPGPDSDISMCAMAQAYTHMYIFTSQEATCSSEDTCGVCRSCGP